MSKPIVEYRIYDGCYVASVEGVCFQAQGRTLSATQRRFRAVLGMEFKEVFR